MHLEPEALWYQMSIQTWTSPFPQYSHCSEAVIEVLLQKKLTIKSLIQSQNPLYRPQMKNDCVLSSSKMTPPWHQSSCYCSPNMLLMLHFLSLSVMLH